MQQHVAGTVIDETGAPLPGATVLEKGTTNEAKTDHDGHFVIQVSPQAILQISFIGYETKEVAVNGQSKVAVQLDPGATQLEDVVVVGYGTQRRSDITGSIASVKSEDFNQGIVTNPGDLLQGKMAGVNISANSGEPGASQNVIIRGIGSL
ncbi:MAG TPA: carboxypeptidase-like regulatory domain-containing protein, partial [Parapedobacter sp.]|nr:carboxypeptidase-like regulatory domain-containing protein [Parapedobacter sp.]